MSCLGELNARFPIGTRVRVGARRATVISAMEARAASGRESTVRYGSCYRRVGDGREHEVWITCRLDDSGYTDGWRPQSVHPIGGTE